MQQRLPTDRIATILDSSGSIVARTHDIDRFLGKKGSIDLRRAMERGPDGYVEGKTVEGLPVLAVFTQLPASRLTIALAIPKASLNADLQRSVLNILAGVVVLLTSSLLLASLLGGRISASIGALIEPALALSRGEKVVAPEVFLQEVAEVGRALQKTSEVLHQARHDAYHDTLTGLANRSLMKEILKQQMELCGRNKTSLAILYIDLDGFKDVNDTHGHAAGDTVLQMVAQRLQSEIRKSDLAARLGGDEFAAVLANTSKAGAAAVAAKLVDCLSQPIWLGSAEVRISASIGIALFPSSAVTIDGLLERADGAMYMSKTSGKRRYTIAEELTDAAA